MKPFTRSILELFDGKRRYLIPLYQRQYAWNIDPQLILLWGDVVRIASKLEVEQQLNAPHFLGAIVVSQVKTFGKEVQAFEVIDGQQRLTTFQLILVAIRDAVHEDAPDYASEMTKYLINEGVMENPEIERYKLWPSLIDREAYIKIIDPQLDLSLLSDSLVRGDVRLSDVEKKSIEAYNFLIKSTKSYVYNEGKIDRFKLEKLFEALKTGLAVVSIELERGDDPQTIFETLNSRGLTLSASDLMRNYVFQRAKGHGQDRGSLIVDQLYKKYWLPLDQSFWQGLESRGRQKAPRIDWMFTDHLSMKLGENISISNLFEKYRQFIQTREEYVSIEHELQDIETSRIAVARLLDFNRNDPLGKFGRFARAFDVSTVYPLAVFLASELSDGDLTKALSALESYIARRDFCRLTTKNYNKFFVEMIRKLRGSDQSTLEYLILLLSAGKRDITRWPPSREFRTNWMNKPQYSPSRQARIAYVLQEIEERKRTKFTEDVIITSKLTVEHIIPRKWKENWQFSQYEHLEEGDLSLNRDYLELSEQRDRKLETMGNLTLLTTELNSSVSNGLCSKKLAAILDQSSLTLNRELRSYLNEDLSGWSEESIEVRGELLFDDYVREIWIEPTVVDQENFTDGDDGESWISRGVVLPSGTQIWMEYGGQEVRGFIQDGIWIVNGNEYTSPSGAAKGSVITVDGHHPSLNGWVCWQVLRPNANEWMLLDDLIEK